MSIYTKACDKCIFVCIYAYVYVYAYVHAGVYEFLYIHILVYSFTYSLTITHIYIYAIHTCAHIEMYIHVFSSFTWYGIQVLRSAIPEV